LKLLAEAAVVDLAGLDPCLTARAAAVPAASPMATQCGIKLAASLALASEAKERPLHKEQPAAFLDLLLEVGADRIMFSADYPFGSMGLARTFLDQLPVSPVDRERIAHGNADSLLQVAT
jgi:predicted TIM-barrel fold metal-dependent hydrolase